MSDLKVEGVLGYFGVSEVKGGDVSTWGKQVLQGGRREEGEERNEEREGGREKG